jgi:transcriptional regulator with XRE-family HTH domain
LCKKDEKDDLPMVGQDIKNTLGKNIKQLRSHRELSQADLAEKARISIQFLSEMERGNQWPRADSLAKIAEALKVPVLSFFREDTPDRDAAGKTNAMLEQFSADIAQSIGKSIAGVFGQYIQFFSDRG